MWRIFISIVAMEMQKCFPFLLNQTNIAVKNIYLFRSSFKCPIFLADFKQIWLLWTDFNKSPPLPNFTKMPEVGTEMIHAKKWTDKTDKRKGVT